MKSPQSQLQVPACGKNAADKNFMQPFNSL
jgi:hypothetical protein